MKLIGINNLVAKDYHIVDNASFLPQREQIRPSGVNDHTDSSWHIMSLIISYKLYTSGHAHTHTSNK